MASNTANPPTESRLSTRISIRWLPEPASETTDTIVMSVKLRVTDSSDPRRVQFTHEIDSHNSFDDVDCGTFTTLPNGDDLETGSMARPDVPGAPVTEYEEVWRELTFKEGPEGSGQGASWVLESKHDIKVGEGEEVEVSRTFFGEDLGLIFGGATEAGKGVSARREEWDASTGWSAKYVLGLEGDSLPSAKDIEANEQLRTRGGTILVNGEPYTVRSYEFA
ncbi:hypothetical protein ANOM_003420 [Aspergillus nomiae NRRL 13137]|uniref:Protein HRI1 n=1 Tax=Aspergillus nomiae NRRL (strain ATCC 15546 / NRRL 13137 / CBS 260.88 / M93) TaxID=1509407 RepID=A0A0L1J816_ASPN3|nr:uncharacterized protein ANOM_003420 [Aspergillus nomiae NRRL 13137]KNG87894.1 hypothetical protein ANOM_003420 [Aspergillus nomiae NRRL 13137]